MPRKRRSGYDMQRDWKEKWRADEARSQKMEAEYPNVEEILIESTFHDMDRGTTFTRDPRRFRPEGHAFFDLACPYRECVRGGFLLNSIVRELVSARKTEGFGELHCEGWQDPERVGQHGRLAELLGPFLGIHNQLWPFQLADELRPQLRLGSPACYLRTESRCGCARQDHATRRHRGPAQKLTPRHSPMLVRLSSENAVHLSLPIALVSRRRCVSGTGQRLFRWSHKRGIPSPPVIFLLTPNTIWGTVR